MTLLNVNSRPAQKTWNGIVNELFSGLENNQPFQSKEKNEYVAPVNITETPASYSLEVLAPGRKKENFGLKIENNFLTISFEEKKQAQDQTKTNDCKQVRKEFSLLSFNRTFSLNEKINTQAIQAKYEDGILKIELPKKAEIKPEATQINIM